MVDQRTKFCTSKAKTRRWTMAVFGYMQEVAAFNKSLEPRSQNSFEFGMTLVLQLVRPFIEVCSSWSLSKSIQNEIKVIPGKRREDKYKSIHLTLPFCDPRKNVDVWFVLTFRQKNKLCRLRSQRQRCGKGYTKDTFLYFATVVGTLNVSLQYFICESFLTYRPLAQLLSARYRCGRSGVRFPGRSNRHSVANDSPPLRRFFGAV